MRHGRLLWAAVMCTAAITVLAGYTAAGEPRWTEPVWNGGRAPALLQTEPQAAEAETPPEPDQETPPEGALQMTVRDETEAVGRKLILTDEDGARICLTAPNRQREYVLEILPGRTYTLTAMDGMAVTFYLEENASVTNVTGNGWSDGEILHLDDRTRCTLRVLRTAGEPLEYTLAGDGYVESRTLQPAGDGAGQAVFAGLLPGTYTLTGPEWDTRTVELTERQPDQAIGLD